MPARSRSFTARAVVTAALLSTILLLGAAGTLPRAVAAPAPVPPFGTVTITITTPTGVPGEVELFGGQHYVAAKPPSGTSATVPLQVAPGLYWATVRPVQFGGRLYTRDLPLPGVLLWVGRGANLKLKVGYTPALTAQDLHATAVDQTSIALAWTKPSGAAASGYSLRRTTGDVAAVSRMQGTAVPVSGTTAVDKSLQPGQRYSYALFTQIHGLWTGPLTLNAGTASPDGTTQAAYIAAPTTLLAAPDDVAAAAPTGSGVHLQLATRTQTPLLGAAVVLPQSDSLPGGFLGLVSAISPDGHNLDLVAGGLSDAFDFYEIDVPDVSEGAPQDLLPNAAPQAQAVPAPGAATDADQKPTLEERENEAAADGPAAVPNVSAAATQGAIECGGSGIQTVTYSPSVSLGGYFHAKVDTKNVLGVNLPKGASLDMSVTATVTGAMSVETSGQVNCHANLGKVFRTLTAEPVPISVSLEPVVQISVDSSSKVSNVGVSVTAGVAFSGSIGVTSGASFSGNPILTAKPLTPQIETSAGIGAKLGGELILGPGAGTVQAGVIAGVGGELDPLDAHFGPVFNDSRRNTCLEASAAFTRSLSVTAKAWVGSWDVSKKVTLSAFTGSTPYGGSPWALPSGCKDATVPQPSESVLGPGVTKVSDSIGGSPTQWGHVDGFAPGQKTWVLSTGLVADATGTPGQLASTDLGAPGDDGLSTLAGQATYDAAFYQVTLIPTGGTLHVKYVFASEEYPEFVGSQFNDVMEVLVDGKNCALVPGTSTPVSINTVNAASNADYYVDNSTGASGYSTSMDGLTVPLTCNVPVTPGKPVTVRIGVADSSDHILDSAVAMVDKGIWTD